MGWIGVDFDGTLAHYDRFEGPDILGEPVPAMVDRVKQWIKEGRDIRIFTARTSHDGTTKRRIEAEHAKSAIQDWCRRNLGSVLPITNVKDYQMDLLYDDRCIQVIKNTGELVEHKQPQTQGGKDDRERRR